MGIAETHLSGQLGDIARDLFEVKSEKGGELIGLCPAPGHDDKNPSFSYNPDKDICHCFSCGFKGDIITLWSTVKGYGDDKEGFRAFCEEFGISDNLDPPAPGRQKPPPEDLQPLNEACAMLGPLPDDWVKKLSRTRAWSPGALEYLGIRQQTHYQEK
ncbi:MAG: CHC2 zinc finger domain-containing protein, partial [Desulfobacterales bacterium]|nr:CHC2 zinc finger domain-containing protein [Desulfobacterales bacterium]